MSSRSTSDNMSAVSRDAGIIVDPVVALMVMGRKRPGFDPDWGARMRQAIDGAMAALPWSVVTPSENIADEAELRRAVEAARSSRASVLVLVQPTISDGRLAPLLSRMWDRPLVLWATPEKPTGAMISANSLVGTHVMAATLRQLGHPLEVVYGDPGAVETAADLERAIRAAHAAGSLVNAKVGLSGYHAPGFVDFHADPVFLNDRLGAQLFHTGTPELINRVNGYTEKDIAGDLSAFEALDLPGTDRFPTGNDGHAARAMQARYYRAFRDAFSEERFDAFAFRCWPDLPSETGHWPYLALARLMSEGFPIAMEGDVDGALCSLLAESAGIGPVYLSDWLEHDRETIAIWHTGAAPFQLCEPLGSERGPRLDVQFNSKLPTVVEATIRPGRALTAFRLWRFDDTYHMCAIEGESVEPRRHLMATNGLFRVHNVDVVEWFDEMVQQGMPHHLCIVPGHRVELLRRVARMTGFAWV